jgi:malate dehydrogenase (oxaloacetate-decarboxylating)(NADP+)
VATKPLANGRDLARAYSPGVAEACLEIKADPATATRYTARGNLVAVVSNGTAVLGLGNIGALASKPVMEGKAVLFKKFANIDCFDIELNENRPREAGRYRLRAGADLRRDQPGGHQGARLLHRRADLPRADGHPGLPRRPARHRHRRGRRGDQRAARRGKRFEDIKIVSTGGGAAGIACLNMLLKLGVKRENVWLCDIHGLVHEGRERT